MKLTYLCLITFTILTLSGLLFADTTYVSSGNVSGIWSAAHSPYILDRGDVTIPSGECLRIGPSVRVVLYQYVQMHVQGCLQAVGTAEDSIIFTHPGDYHNWYWNHIFFDQASDSSVMEYCIVEYGNGEDSTGFNEGGGVYVYDTNMNFRNCAFRHNYSDWQGGGVSVFYCDCRFDSCLFFDNIGGTDGGGLAYCWGNPIFRYCEFYDNISDGNGGGLAFIIGTLYIEYCSFNHNQCPYGYGGGLFAGAESVSISNCTFWGNFCQAGGAHISSISSNCIFTNIIFENSVQQEAVNFTSPLTVSIAFCSFYDNEGNLNGYNPPGFGQLTAVNANMDSCDVYYNIFLPSLMIDPANKNHNLQPSSPCIDAGDPNYPLDPDWTTADIGAVYFDQSPVEDLIISVSGGDVYLDWMDKPSVSIYRIYRSELPYFDTAGMTPYDETGESEYIDYGAVNEVMWYYRVTWE